MIFKLLIICSLHIAAVLYCTKFTAGLAHALERSSDILKNEVSMRACASALTGIKNIEESAKRLRSADRIKNASIESKSNELKKNFLRAAHVLENCKENANIHFEIVHEGKSGVSNFIYKKTL